MTPIAGKSLYIHSVELHGFKTFADRTRLLFTDGINAVVGPNGSGKSNVFDAIKWCVGEQSPKQLRGGRMADVLFHGSDNRSPSAYAAVTIVLANPDGKAPPPYNELSEIAIERRLYQSGDTEYKINESRVRLRDVQEFWLDCAIGDYTFMEQGRVADLVQARPVQVRGYIEEAAQIVKFRKRVEESQRKFETARVHLDVLDAALREEEKNLAYLGRQARKAERYRELAAELETVDIAWLRGGLESVLVDIHLLAEQVQSLVVRKEELDRAVVNAESGLSADHARITVLKEKIRHLYEERAEWTQAVEHHRAAATHAGFERERLSSRNQQLNGSWQKLAVEEQRLLEQAEKCKESLDLADHERIRLTEEVSAVEKMAAAEQLRLDSLIEEERRCQSELFQTLNQLTDRRRMLAERSFRRAEQEEKAVRLRALIDSAEQQVRNTQVGLDELRQSANIASAARMAGQEQREEARAVVEELRDRVLTLEQEHRQQLVRLQEQGTEKNQLDAMLALGRERDDALYHAAQAGDMLRGRLADVLTVPENLDESTEKATGPLLRGWVVGPEKKQEFLRLLVEMPTQELYILPECTTDLGATLNALFLPGLWHDVAGDNPVDTTRYMVKSGNFVRNWGSLSLAGAQKPGGELVLRRRAALVTERFNRAQLRKGEIDSELETARSALAAARDQLDEADGRLEKLHKETDRLQAQVASAEQTEAVAVARVLDLQNQLAASATELAQDPGVPEESALLDRLQQEQEELEARLEKYHHDRAESARLVRQIRERSSTLRNQQMDHSNRCIDLRNALHNADAKVQENKANRQRHQEEIKVNQERLIELQQQHTAASESLQKREIELDQLTRTLRQIEQDADLAEGGASEQEERLRIALAQRNSTETDLVRAQEKLSYRQEKRDQLVQQALDNYQRDLLAEPLHETDYDQLTEQRHELEGRLRKLGGIDSDAIEEFGSRQKEYDSKIIQKEDLLSSITKLTAAISELEQEAERRFSRTFSEIEQHFRDVFPRLFPGGRAELRLEESDGDELPGIQIMAYPPGKKFTRIELLSGGEKSLTATAFILSIFLCNPSPFCLLDELDAPLDDANLELLGSVLKDMNERSQVILITHNKQTMQLADRIYGVTLQEPGVSSVYSIDPGAY